MLTPEEKAGDLQLPEVSLVDKIRIGVQAELGGAIRLLIIRADPERENGIILEGSVPSFHAKQIAWQVAVRTPGVASAVDFIEVISKNFKNGSS